MHQVVFAVQSLSILSSYTLTLPSTVHTLGMRVIDGQVSAVNLKQLFNALLPSYVACTPALKTIKFMEAKNIQALRSYLILLWCELHVMEKSGVAIKDLDDRLIVPLSCQVLSVCNDNWTNLSA
jgi:hypothetical protein